MCISFDELNDEHQAIINTVFEDPPRPDILWLRVLALFKALSGTIREIDYFICVEIESSEGIRRCVFPYSGDQGCVSRHMIEYLRNYLRGVGVEPN